MASVDGIRSRGGWGVIATLLFAGCASAPRVHPGAAAETFFEPVATIDTRELTMEQTRSLLKTGDVIVTYMAPHHALARRCSFYYMLPHGHSILVVDPHHEKPFFDLEFAGGRRSRLKKLGQYTSSTVYRLRSPHRLNEARLREFVDTLCQRGGAQYSFKSWFALNEGLRPERPEDIASHYNCSSMVAAAYHYAGVTLSLTKDDHALITPLALTSSTGAYNSFALPERAPSPATDIEQVGHETNE